jgi:serine/threonine protein kinase
VKAEDRLKHAIETFASLGLPNWSINHSGQVSQGGNSGVCVVERKDGKRGVFRCLPSAPQPEAISRFQRELDVLSKIEHKNIMKLLESSSESPFWYISELGTNFRDYWKDYLKTNAPDQIERHALDIVRCLAQGLAVCHEKGVVHRDIKPNNIIVLPPDNAPVLIDFGVAWVSTEDRITLAGQAVGNARFSPDHLRQKKENPPPWVDLFELIQVFLWMIVERDPKHFWQRPIHWKYIDFPSDLSPDFCELVRALSAIASSIEISPKNGTEFLSCLDKLFNPKKDWQADGSHVLTNEIETVSNAIASGKAKKWIREAGDHEILDASIPLADLRYRELVAELNSLVSEPKIKIANRRNVRDFSMDEMKNGALIPLRFECGDGSSNGFTVTIRLSCWIPSLWPNGGKPKTIENANVFGCEIIRSEVRNSRTLKSIPECCLNLSISNQSSFLLHGPSWHDPTSEIQLGEIVQKVKDLLYDPQVWELIADN